MKASAVPPSTRLTPAVWKRHLLAAFIALIAVFFGWDAIRSAPAPPKAFRDAALMQTGAQCFVDRCDPYSAQASMQEDAMRGALKVPVAADELMYPPSTFLLLLPLVDGGWPEAGVLWCWFGVLLVAMASAALVETMRLEQHLMVLLPLLALLVSTPLHSATGAAFNNNLHTGNPTLAAAPMVALACLLLLGGEHAPLDSFPGAVSSILGWIVLGAALALKPQLAVGPLAALFGHARTRKSSLKAVALGLCIFVASIAVLRLRLGSFAFFANWVADCRLTIQPGHILDVSPANPISRDMLPLQHVAYFFGIAKPWPDVLAWSVFGLLVVGAVLINARTAAWRRLVWCSVALCVLLSILPVYHNKYDRLILLAVIPAFAEVDTRTHRATAWLLSIVAAFWALTEQVFDHVLGRAAYWPVNGTIPLVLCVLLLWAMAQREQSTLLPTHAQKGVRLTPHPFLAEDM